MTVVVLAMALSAAGLSFSASGAAALAADDPDGVGITIEVVGPTVDTPPATTPVTPPWIPPRGGPVTQETITDPVGVDEELGDEPFDLGGVLYVSGLTGSASPSLHPDNGTVTLKITVRNTSATSFDSTLRFWLENAVGATIAEAKKVKVASLAAGETRTVTASMTKLGQWTLFHGHATLTPPKVVEGTSLVPLTRDTVVTMPPFFGLVVGGGVAALGGLAWWLIRLVRLRA